LKHIQVWLEANASFQEVLVASLSEVGYEAFVQGEGFLEAYIPEALFSESSLQELLEVYGLSRLVRYHFREMEERNWNEEWEKSYEPIRIGDALLIRASFHATEGYPMELVINPKMSFGTGHHFTTTLMLEQQLQLGHAGKSVLDVGCGTGILAIMAAKSGAKHVVAFDIDEWAYENTRENVLLNQTPQVEVRLGSIEVLDKLAAFDIILANINRNVHLNQMSAYAARITTGGLLVLSGFYEADGPDIVAHAIEYGFRFTSQLNKQGWTSLVLQA
jgi:ribosomal protein L11 methyltransferase